MSTSTTVGIDNIHHVFSQGKTLKHGVCYYMMRGGVIMQRIGIDGMWSPSLIRYNDLVATCFEVLP